jgi:hypothetical protein
LLFVGADLQPLVFWSFLKLKLLFTKIHENVTSTTVESQLFTLLLPVIYVYLPWSIKRYNQFLYKVKSKSNLNCSVKRQQLELERWFFLYFSQVSHRPNALVAVLIPPSKDSAGLVFSNGHMIPTQLILKLSWDSERLVSSDFSLGKRKANGGNIQ